MRTSEEKKWNPPPAHIVPKQVDAMPKEVATEMLCRSRRITNSQRKEYMRARCRVFESNRTRQEPIDKLAKRLQGVTWAQLVRWETRTVTHRKGVQDAHQLTIRSLEKAKAEQPKTKSETVVLGARIVMLERALAVLEMKAAQLDVFWDALDTEKGRRGRLIENLRMLNLPEFATKLESATIAN